MMKALTMDYQLTLPAILCRTRAHFGDKRVVSRRADGSIARTCYGAVLERADRLRTVLAGLGVTPGDRVATLGWNSARHLEAYYAVPAMGAVLHTLNVRLPAEELGFIASDAEDRILLVDDDLLPLVERFRADTPFRYVIVMRDGEGALPHGWLDYETLVAAAAPAPPGPDLSESAPAVMCYTSGTTGKPKGVVYSHRGLVLHSLVSGLSDVFGVRESDVVLPIVPMFHANSWGLPFTTALVGADLVLPGRQLDARSVRDLLAGERVTFTAGVPTVWTALLDLLDREPGAVDLSALRAVVVGGAAVPEALMRAFAERHGIEVVHAWGMTELAPVGTVSRLPARLAGADEDERYRHRVRQGPPVPFVEVRARGDAGLVPWDDAVVGELEVRGPWVASGYHGLGTGSGAFTDDGWFRTGDVVAIDPWGSIAIRDRAKDLIKSGGEWISSVALENRLMGHPAVLEAAVVAVKHPKWDERPLAAVVLKQGRQATVEELRSFVAEACDKWCVPDAIVFVESLPKTGTGKIVKARLREQFRQHYGTAE
jgi:fatty-acyl-CoA synthase